MTDVEATSYSPAVSLARLGIYEPLLCLNDCTRLALVVNAKHLAPDLKFAALASYGNWLQEFEFTLAVKDMFGVELGYTSDGFGVGARVEVNDLLIGMFEGQDNGVCRKGSKLRVQLLVGQLASRVFGSSIAHCAIDVAYIEEVKLFWIGSADTRREKKQIALKP